MDTPFYLAPTLLINGMINYRTPKGRKLFEKSINKLNEELCDCTAEDLQLFIDSLPERAQEMWWIKSGVGINYVLINTANIDANTINLYTNTWERRLMMN